MKESEVARRWPIWVGSVAAVSTIVFLLSPLVASTPHSGRPSGQLAKQVDVPTANAILSPVPTYMVYAQVVNATAAAIAQTIPTPSPIPGLHPDLQESAKRSYIVDIALQTAVALYPPPPNYDPQSEITPYVPLTPLPTEAPLPKTLTQNGAIYNRSLEDNPIGRLLNSQNYWMGNTHTDATSVYAGSEKLNPDHGVIVVKSSVLEGGERVGRITEYQAPAQVGALRIITEAGGLLTLQAANGEAFVFDLNIRQWVSPPSTSTPGPSPSALVSPVPSGTPVPTQAP